MNKTFFLNKTLSLSLLTLPYQTLSLSLLTLPYQTLSLPLEKSAQSKDLIIQH